MRPILVAGALALAACATDAEPQEEPRTSVEICGEEIGAASVARGSLTVADHEGSCTVDVREVVRLQGAVDGIAPRWPVALGPGGTYVTGTYQPGKLAIWSESGDLVRVVGKGRGQGPGEFERTSGLVVDADTVINVFPGLPHWHRFTWSGEYIETIRSPTTAGLSDPVSLPDGTVAALANGASLSQIVTWHADAGVRVIDAGPPGPKRLDASPVSGLWTLLFSEYTIRHHEWPGGAVDLQLRRNPEWFQREAEIPSYMSQLAVDDRGLVWAFANVPSPSAPAAPRPTADRPEDRLAIASEYRDAVLEVITWDGRIVATRVFDDLSETGWVLTADRWVYEADDPLRSLVIVEPVLIER